MKSLLKYASILGSVLTIIALTACGGQPSFDVTLNNGDDLAVETDHFSLTNQEMFEIVSSGYVQWVNPGVSTILNWADSVILSDLVEINEERIDDERETVENFFDEDEQREMLILGGFESLDDHLENIRLQIMREQYVEDQVEITEEEIEATYNEWFVHDDVDDADDVNDADDVDDADDIDDADDVDEESDENETPDLEDVREMIEDMLRSEILEEQGFDQKVLAELRAESGLTIYSNYFASHYEDFLDSWGVEDVDVATGDSDDAVASINGHTLTIDELFDLITRQFAVGQQSQLFDYIDRNVLNEVYDVNDNTIRDIVNEEKRNMLEWFYPQMEARGLFTERQIFNFFLLSHLQDLAFDDAFLPLSDERLQELYDLHIELIETEFIAEFTPQRGVRHILIPENDERSLEEAHDQVEELIERLQEVPEDEVEDLFIELAEEYSTCPSGLDGGDLGVFGIGDMVSEFDEAAFALELGEFTTEPIETEFGFHAIYVYYIEELELDDDGEEADTAPEIPTFEEIEETLIDSEIQRLQMMPQYVAHVMFGLRADQNIRFHSDLLQEQYDTMLEQNRRSVEDDE